MKKIITKNKVEDTKKIKKNEIEMIERIKTGYPALDKKMSLYPGLYVIGAISSLGKTTFANQMADQIAEQGKSVLYISLEQSSLELTAKSISRITRELNWKTARTAMEIRTEKITDATHDAIKIYDKYNSKISVIDTTNDDDEMMTIDNIEQAIRGYIETTNTIPVVFVDYLQAIKVSGSQTKKDAVDECMRRLKKIQKKYKMIMIVISSFNRQNYMSQVSFESFKETGDIEYTADCVWGMQLKAINLPLFDVPGRINEKRKVIMNELSGESRSLELCCLKARYGEAAYTVSFNYMPKYDYFESVE
jgi:replicative DNA helicase